MFSKDKDSVIKNKVSQYHKENPYKYGLIYSEALEKHKASYDAEIANEPAVIEKKKKDLENYKNELKRDIAEIDAQLRNLR